MIQQYSEYQALATLIYNRWLKVRPYWLRLRGWVQFHLWGKFHARLTLEAYEYIMKRRSRQQG